VCNTENINMCFNLTNDYRLRLTNDRPDLSSERAPKKKTGQHTSDINLLKENSIWSRVTEWARHQDVLSDRLSSFSGSSGASWTTNEREPTYQRASRSYEFQAVDYESACIASRPERRTGPIASFPAQPSSRESTALHSVQYSNGPFKD
jgi:hypothetical protein